jgi:hypothetical protein
MTPLFMVLYVALGLFIGYLSGLIGIGGGVVLVPILVYLFKYTQHQAQGTTLALMVPPIGLLAAWTYYKNGYVDLRVAGLLCIGFILGGLLGAKTAIALPDVLLKRIFGAALLLVSLKMLLGK